MKTRITQVALNLPRTVALLIVYGRHVVEMMTANAAIFQNPDPSMASASSHLDDLASAETHARTRALGAAAVRDEKKKVVVDDLVLLKGVVQARSLRDPALALSIILASGMSVKGFTFHHKPTLAAVMGPSPQEALLRAKAVKGRAAYEWQVSSDGGATWVAVGVTTRADTTVPGLIRGVTYQFRHRVTQKRVTGEWSDPVSLRVW